MDIFLEYLLPIVATLLASLLTALTAYATAWLRAKARREETLYQEAAARAVLDYAGDEIADAVAEVDQTTVDAWKVGGQHLTTEMREEAKTTARATAVRNLGPARMRVLTAVLGAATESWIGTKIEATVAARRRSKARAENPVLVRPA